MGGEAGFQLEGVSAPVREPLPAPGEPRQERGPGARGRASGARLWFSGEAVTGSLGLSDARLGAPSNVNMTNSIYCPCDLGAKDQRKHLECVPANNHLIKWPETSPLCLPVFWPWKA